MYCIRSSEENVKSIAVSSKLRKWSNDPAFKCIFKNLGNVLYEFQIFWMERLRHKVLYIFPHWFSTLDIKFCCESVWPVWFNFIWWELLNLFDRQRGLYSSFLQVYRMEAEFVCFKRAESLCSIWLLLWIMVAPWGADNKNMLAQLGSLHSSNQMYHDYRSIVLSGGIFSH